MDKNQINLFSSKKTDNWRTPPKLLEDIKKEFGSDLFDPCPINSNFNGLNINWPKKVYVNPPYSKVELFLKKAWLEIEKGNTELAIFLTFANTDTKWFHKYVYGRSTIRFIKGRLKFLTEDNKVLSSAMRPSILIIMR